MVMGHRHLVGAAGCAMAIALAIGGGARAEEIRVASLTPGQAASAAGSDQVNFAFNRAGQSEARLAVADTASVQPVADDKTSHKRPKTKHAPCVHGEWVTPEDYNPWTLACRPVGEF
jgi:hypothetical protein